MNKLAALCLFLLFLSCNSKSKYKDFESTDTFQKQILGFYEYQANGSNRNQYVLIDTLKNKIYGIYYRTEPKRGQGQWYYANSVTDLKFEGDTIEFNLGNRKLFGSQPVLPGRRFTDVPSLRSSKKDQKLRFRGRFFKGVLSLECSSDKGDCPAEMMVFKRIPLPD